MLHKFFKYISFVLLLCIASEIVLKVSLPKSYCEVGLNDIENANNEQEESEKKESEQKEAKEKHIPSIFDKYIIYKKGLKHNSHPIYCGQELNNSRYYLLPEIPPEL